MNATFDAAQDPYAGRITRQIDGTVVFAPERPLVITINRGRGDEREEVHDTLAFRRPTAGEVRKVTALFQSDPLGAGYDLALGLSAVPARLLADKLDPADVIPIGTIGLGFIMPSRPTGTT